MQKMEKIKEDFKTSDLDKELNESYQEALKDLDFMALVKKLKISEDTAKNIHLNFKIRF